MDITKLLYRAYKLRRKSNRLMGLKTIVSSFEKILHLRNFKRLL